MFLQYEKEFDESNQIIKGYQKFFGDDKYKNDVLNKVFQNNIKKILILKKMRFTKLFLSTDLLNFRINTNVKYN